MLCYAFISRSSKIPALQLCMDSDTQEKTFQVTVENNSALCQWRKLLKAPVISTSQPSLISHCKNANCPVTLKTIVKYPHLYIRRLHYLEQFLYMYQYIHSCLPTSDEPLLPRHFTFALKAPWMLRASPLSMASISSLWAHLKSRLLRGLFSGGVQGNLWQE